MHRIERYQTDPDGDCVVFQMNFRDRGWERQGQGQGQGQGLAARVEWAVVFMKEEAEEVETQINEIVAEREDVISAINKLRSANRSKLLKNYHLVFDLPGGVLRIGPPQSRTDERPPDAIAVEFADDRIRLPMQYGGDKSGWMLLATSAYDTFFDAATCRSNVGRMDAINPQA